jgi:hypothetical protein
VTISEAQLEIRTRFVGGSYGQFVSGVVWLTSAGLAVWRGPRASILMLVIGGVLIFPATELLIRAVGERVPVSPANALRWLGMQVAFVLPFVFLYGMRMFAVLAALLIGGGTLIALYWSASFSVGAWYTGTILLVFAGFGRLIVDRECRDTSRPHASAPPA